MEKKLVTIPPKYPNKKFILYGTGPSLTEEVIETIRPYKKDFIHFGINDAYKVVDFLDEHYVCDHHWWQVWGKDFRIKYPNLSCWSQTLAYEDAIRYNAKVVDGKFEDGLSLKNDIIHYGMNSGYQALNIAFLMGGCKFILVGYNMGPVNNKSHYFGDHPGILHRPSPYPLFARNFSTIQSFINKMVVNCTEPTGLVCFRRNLLKEELKNNEKIYPHTITIRGKYSNCAGSGIQFTSSKNSFT